MDVEARRIIDAARRRGVVLRLIGGLGIRLHCREIGFCERDYSDIDLVGHAREAASLPDLFAELGYRENPHVRIATLNRQMQFARPCSHGGQGVTPHADDHVDVFLDTFKMDHAVSLRERLEMGPYTISVSDLLLTKLQIYRTNEKDIHDILTILKDVRVGVDDAADAVSADYLAALCARDWGLFYDVAMNLGRCREHLGDYDLTDEELSRIVRGLDALIAAIDAAPKTVVWRVRARVGTRRPWHDEVEEQE